MDIDKLTNPSQKRLEIGKYTGDEKDFLTIKLYSLKSRSVIYEAQKQGLDIKILQDFMTERGIFNMNDPETKKEFMENKELSSGFQLEDYDPFRTAYKTAVLKYGICKDNHSFVKNGQPILIDDDFIDILCENYPVLVDFLVEEIEKYQSGLVLGESKKRKSVTP